ncbi:cyclopropane-fatty-acyl-phospholipid synthase [Pseudodonghicola xiamenensis]|uniref:Cyclopropane-fatty-acyl-phospholipid synthase n=2 Tax=Pseudodonghicola xiamenensis TaxID=337702 RepID=A0A8J3H8X2_9RHOB|nr:cyclopropane-fatty-acyl-phospholipid synthase [Pseudodonghicola xiamenensis]
MMLKLIKKGQLTVTFPDGETKTYGSTTDPSCEVRLTDEQALRALCLKPELALGESYMDGTLQIAGDDPEALLRVLLRNARNMDIPIWARFYNKLRYAVQAWAKLNTPKHARQNVAHHYDISDDLYRLFLDEDMQYSCAYFTDPDMSLEDAQVAKKAHIAAKLQIEPGMKVLDIGCGWGGMAITLARDYGADVTGVTLSENQLATARRRAEAAGVAGRTDFRLQDYRALNQTFDRIVSVGMLEHVGVPFYGVYFNQISHLLNETGVALIHTIGSLDPAGPQAEWITKYIFPGGYIPSLSQLAPAIERSGLWSLDIEILRLHYAMTLRHWLARFDEKIDIVRQSYDDRFIRMWRFYLIACFMTFEEEKQVVFQLQLGHQRAAVPLTRDYMYQPTGIPLQAQADPTSQAAE